MSRIPRILAVTLGLSAAGALIGFAAGAASLLVALTVTGEAWTRYIFELLGIGGAYGAMIGAVAAPVASWLFMRHVPFGRSIAWTTVGTVVGGVIGWTTFAHGNQVAAAIYGAIGGFLLAVSFARHRTPTRTVPGTAEAHLLKEGIGTLEESLQQGMTPDPVRR